MRFVFDQIKELMHPAFLAEVAHDVHHGEDTTRKALDLWSAAILGKLSQYADRPRAMNRIYEGLSTFPDQVGQPALLLPDRMAVSEDGTSRAAVLLEQLFGERMSALRAVIAERSGLSSAASARLLRIAGPVVLGVLGRRLRHEELSVSGLANLLRKERSRLASALDPAVADVLDLPPYAESEQVEDSGQTEGLRWGATLAIVATLGVVTLLIFRQCAGSGF